MFVCSCFPIFPFSSLSQFPVCSCPPCFQCLFLPFWEPTWGDKETGKLVFGPYAADGFFGSKNYTNFDGVLAMYHDQGLAPFKALSFGNGVNFTAGLDKIRTSPDHGTGYDIAGKGKANPDSFKEALFTSLKIFKNRKELSELKANALKTK